MIVHALAPFALAATLAVGGHPAPTPVTEAQTAVLIAEAKVVTRAMAEACQRLDIDAATQDFLIGPATVMIGSDAEIADPTAFREGLRAFYASLSRLHFTTSREEFRVLAPDLILYVWSYRVDGTSKNSGPWVIDAETVSSLLRKIDGGWKFISYHESATPLRRLPAPTAN